MIGCRCRVLTAVIILVFTTVAILTYMSYSLQSWWLYQGRDNVNYVMEWTSEELESSYIVSDRTPPFTKFQLTLEELTEVLKYRIQEQRHDEDKIVYTEPCRNLQSLGGCTDDSCQDPLNSSHATRLEQLLTSPQLKLSDAQRDTILSIADPIPVSDVIFVSATSSNHYDEAQAMFKNVHTTVQPLVKNATVVLFDIGLTKDQREMTESHCRCIVVTFPKEKFPSHVSNNLCYSWKPLIILATISKARKLVVWQDASIRWSKQINAILNRAEKYGQQIIRYFKSSRVPAHTLKQTFDYMGEDPCAFMPYPEIESSCHVHKRDALVVQAILEPWARCALEMSCMCPVTSPESVLGCNKALSIHRCHRFDQSALTMILAKVYAEDMYKVLAPEYSFVDPQYVSIQRNTKNANYFKSL